MPDDKFLPDIESYLEKNNFGFPVEIDELDDIIDSIVEETGFSKRRVYTIVHKFFEEVRTSMLRGEVVNIYGLGKLYIAGQKTSTNKQKTFIRFELCEALQKKLNGRI